MIYQLIESQTRILMLADVREDYRFQVIDPSYVPEARVSPNRMMIIILGTLAGGLFAVLWVLMQNGRINYRARMNQKDS